jgi:hypothetical protein
MSDQEDIVGGKVYQTLLSTNPDFFFSVMLHSDGIPLYRSRTCSAWPILGAVVELPPFCRNRCDNILLLSVWIGKEKPSFDVILAKLSQQLMHLKDTGLEIEKSKGSIDTKLIASFIQVEQRPSFALTSILIVLRQHQRDRLVF